MKKEFMVIVLIGIIMAIIAGCGRTASQADPTQPSEIPAAPVQPTPAVQDDGLPVNTVDTLNNDLQDNAADELDDVSNVLKDW